MNLQAVPATATNAIIHDMICCETQFEGCAVDEIKAIIARKQELYKKKKAQIKQEKEDREKEIRKRFDVFSDENDDDGKVE